MTSRTTPRREASSIPPTTTGFPSGLHPAVPFAGPVPAAVVAEEEGEAGCPGTDISLPNEKISRTLDATELPTGLPAPATAPEEEEEAAAAGEAAAEVQVAEGDDIVAFSALGKEWLTYCSSLGDHLASSPREQYSSTRYMSSWAGESRGEGVIE